MKKIITTLMMAAMFAVMIPAFSTSAAAQTRYYYNSRGRLVRVYKRPNVYQRHRHLFNIAIGTGAGAIIGGLIGGRRGAGIGALAGAGGGALYTYKLNPKRTYYRNY